jgi:hypothetical protein
VELLIYYDTKVINVKITLVNPTLLSPTTPIMAKTFFQCDNGFLDIFTYIAPGITSTIMTPQNPPRKLKMLRMSG